MTSFSRYVSIAGEKEFLIPQKIGFMYASIPRCNHRFIVEGK